MCSEATFGFNVKKGVFEHTWVDTMGTRISFHEGKGEVVDGKLVVTFNGPSGGLDRQKKASNCVDN